ncbi:MAG: ADP-ribosylglycohydrolase family protein [Clostridia bacterium]|nr:ADP-ribosylglycohydrolase family protein [Clostridia bacterium]
MIGAIFGDIVGSVYEFNNIKTKNFELFGKKCFFTDDTVITVAVADALMQCANDIELFKQIFIKTMHRYGKKYPDAGYGGRFSDWLYYERIEPYNSFGNGSAMRVSPVAWYADSLEKAIAYAKASAEVTHNHPEGIKGAVVTAGATYLARTGASMEQIKDFVGGYYDMNFTLDEIRPTYYFNETCQNTVPQAMQAFFESTSFEDAIRNGISIGGDSDTLCAITGAVADAYYGLTEVEKKKALSYLDEELSGVVERFQNR